MKRRVQLTIGLGLSAALTTLGLTAAPVAGAHPAKPASAKAVAVHLHRFSVGKALVNSHGRAMYMFGRDTHDKSHCGKSCRAFWPPVISRKKPIAGTGISATHLRRLGNHQLAYYGHPLYYFVLDTKAGTDKGEGRTEFGGTWYVVSAKGVALKPRKTGHPTPPYVPPAPTSAADVSTGTVNAHTVLVDGNGMTLYYLSSENASRPTIYCTDTCQKTWIPLLTQGDPTVGGDAQVAKLGTLTRTDDNSEVQVTYNGHPLYRFAGDSAPGDHNGEGLYDIQYNYGYWYELDSSGAGVVP